MTKKNDKYFLKVGVVGSRRRNSDEDRAYVFSVLDKLKEDGPLLIISGGCPQGADRFAEEAAREFGLDILVHMPDYNSLPENPKRWHYTKMYYARNSLIARDCDVLLALPAADRKGGTEDTIKKTKKLDKKVVLI